MKMRRINKYVSLPVPNFKPYKSPIINLMLNRIITKKGGFYAPFSD